MSQTSNRLAVVVLALGAPPTAIQAVRSLLDQKPPAEVVVVNSGGGDMKGLLQRHGIDVPVIESDERLYAGAARNRGIRATQAPFVAFLAADCLATPGWVRERLEAHESGVAAVGSAVMNSHAHNPFAWAAHLTIWARRLPGAEKGLPFGASYKRQLFEEHGLFREDLPRGEDGEFHTRLPPRQKPIWNSAIITIHRNPTRFWPTISDLYRRGGWQARVYHEVYHKPLRCGVGAWYSRTRNILRASRQVSKSYRLYVLLAWPMIPLATIAYYLGAWNWERNNSEV
jgi:glycosyltransferase involved in cell wall biosynthesis